MNIFPSHPGQSANICLQYENIQALAANDKFQDGFPHLLDRMQAFWGGTFAPRTPLPWLTMVYCLLFGILSLILYSKISKADLTLVQEIAELRQATRKTTVMQMDAQHASMSNSVLAEARKLIREEIDAVIALKGTELLTEFNTNIQRIDEDILARNRDFTGLLESLDGYQTSVRSVNKEVMASKKEFTDWAELLGKLDSSVRRIDKAMLARDRKFTDSLELLEEVDISVQRIDADFLARKKDFTDSVERLNKIDSSVQRIDEQILAMNKKFTDSVEKLQSRIQALEQAQVGHESARATEIADIHKKIDHEVKNLESRMRSIEEAQIGHESTEATKISNTHKKIDREVENLTSRMQSIEEAQVGLKDTEATEIVDTHKKIDPEVENLRNRIQSIEQAQVTRTSETHKKNDHEKLDHDNGKTTEMADLHERMDFVRKDATRISDTHKKFDHEKLDHDNGKTTEMADLHERMDFASKDATGVSDTRDKNQDREGQREGSLCDNRDLDNMQGDELSMLASKRKKRPSQIRHAEWKKQEKRAKDFVATGRARRNSIGGGEPIITALRLRKPLVSGQNFSVDAGLRQTRAYQPMSPKDRAQYRTIKDCLDRTQLEQTLLQLGLDKSHTEKHELEILKMVKMMTDARHAERAMHLSTLQSKEDLQKSLGDFGLNMDDIEKRGKDPLQELKKAAEMKHRDEAMQLVLNLQGPNEMWLQAGSWLAMQQLAIDKAGARRCLDWLDVEIKGGENHRQEREWGILAEDADLQNARKTLKVATDESKIPAEDAEFKKTRKLLELAADESEVNDSRLAIISGHSPCPVPDPTTFLAKRTNETPQQLIDSRWATPAKEEIDTDLAKVGQPQTVSLHQEPIQKRHHRGQNRKAGQANMNHTFDT